MSTNSSTIAWPPEITVKKHPRARYVKLKASLRHGLELVVPKNFSNREIPHILEENKTWIEKQLLKIQAEFQHKDSDALPNEIYFLAIQHRWQIEYISSSSKSQLITRPHQQLVFLGKTQIKDLCKTFLITWMKEQAQTHLMAQLALISKEINLPYTKGIIRDQSTRWGSCSVNKSISLNYKLLFLPHALMRHIIIHELCHTVHLNHSAKFWGLVKSFDPDWQIHRKTMQTADKFVPRWIK